MIVRHQIWEVGVARGKHELHLIISDFDHLGDGFDDRLCSRFRFFAKVHLQGFDHVIRAKRLAVVKGYTLTQIERPSLGVCCGFPAFSQFANKATIGRNFGQAVKHCALTACDHEDVRVGPRIPAIAGIGTGQTRGQLAAACHLSTKWQACGSQHTGCDTGF